MKTFRSMMLYIIVAVAGATLSPMATPRVSADDSLVLHYRFDQDPGDLAKDHSRYGNDGKVVNGEYVEQFEGRQGVMRFDGRSAYLDCGNDESIYFEGDMSFEMWVRLNRPIRDEPWAFIFGESPIKACYFTVASYHTLTLWYNTGGESMVVPVDRRILNEQWSHIAVVVEHPRCRFYHNGQLIRDAYLPLPAIPLRGNQHKNIGGKEDGDSARSTWTNFACTGAPSAPRRSQRTRRIESCPRLQQKSWPSSRTGTTTR